MEKEQPASWREWLGLAILALPTFLLALDFTALHLALPHLSASLSPTGTQQLWILDMYGFMIAGFLVTMGSLGDRIGRRKLLLRGALVFGLCSVAAAFSVSAEMLIAARALLGVAGATLMPSTLSLIGNMFRQAGQRQFAIAVWLGCFSLGGAIGPMVGGMLLEWFWWGAVFLLGVPVMLLLLLTGPFLLPEYRDESGVPVDLPSVLLSIAAMLSVIYGIKELPGSPAPAFPGLMLLAGVGFGWLFVRRQRKLRAPLVDLQLFASRPFNISLASLLTVTVVLGAFVLFFAQYLQLVAGMSPLIAGLWMIPYALANIAGAMLTPLLANRFRLSHVIAGGLAVAAVGFALLFVMAPAGPSGLAMIVGTSVLVTIGLSPLMVLSTELVVSSAPPAKTGSASSLSETCSELGMATGIALLGTVGSIIYRKRIVQSDMSDALPAEWSEPVREHLSGAVQAASRLPGTLADSLITSAREAFMAGFQTVGGICTLLLSGLIVLFLTVLREVKRAE